MFLPQQFRGAGHVCLPRGNFQGGDTLISDLGAEPRGGGEGEEQVGISIASAQNGIANIVSNLDFKIPLKGQLQFSH